ncbi:dual specificity phosphatase [Penicillium atrosanguineum]|uniref:protein-tyrosine-phosphatase n=2 Tax=Penicillium atrosanguineum TaxID=1132637 RepID=A0A9W9Q6Q3_9EURO|nr:dual specificity phosphatase [Penicillium atrosanguineum]KAJ5324267.1 dual specificity phosphatase [Penicillium atrosanguineum]
MAMNQIPGQNIYIGGIFCLKNKAALDRANITHVVSVLRLAPSENLFSDFKQHRIDIDDVDDENLLEHLPAAVNFIQSGLDAGGSVLVHCAMGKSRSATVCIAYMLHQQRSGLTPQSALEVIRQSRPLCEPNDGFMEQLNLYHEMGCPDEVADHPVYQRWLYRREVEESVACGRAPELKSVRFEDEQPQRPQEPTAQVVEIKCRKCRRGIADSKYIISHDQEKKESNKYRSNQECAHVFLHPMKWMRPSLFPEAGPNDYEGDAPLTGRLACPNTSCGANLGKFAWQGLQCNCGQWVVPAIGLAKARVDIANKAPVRGAGNLPPTALGIRMPPGMRGPESSDGSGRGNL